IRDFHVTGVQTCALPIYEVRTIGRDEGVSGRRVGSGFQDAIVVHPHDASIPGHDDVVPFTDHQIRSRAEYPVARTTCRGLKVDVHLARRVVSVNPWTSLFRRSDVEYPTMGREREVIRLHPDRHGERTFSLHLVESGGKGDARCGAIDIRRSIQATESSERDRGRRSVIALTRI